MERQLFTVDSARVEDVRSAIAKVPPLLTSSINTRYDRAVQIADGPDRQVYLDRPTQDVKPLQVEEIVVSEPPDGPLVLRPGLKSFSYVADPRQSQPIVLEVRQESKPDATGVLVKLVPARTKELANSVFVRLLPEHAPFLTETADEQALRQQARQGSGP